MRTPWLILISMIIGALLGYALHAVQENTPIANSNIEEVSSQLDRARLDSIRGENLGGMMAVLMVLVDTDLKLNGSISDTNIQRIAAASAACKPYYRIQRDTISNYLVSPERGFLLSMLLASEVDSTSMSKIIKHVSFSYADLSGANLMGKNLVGIDLTGARLEGANAKGVDFSNANLQYCDLAKADVSGADFAGSDLTHASFAMAKADQANFQTAKMKGVNFNRARLRMANFHSADAEWSNFTNALAPLVDFRFARLKGADLSKTVLNRGSFEFSELSKARFTEAIIDSTIWDSALVSNSDWLEVDLPKAIGFKHVTERYKLIADTNLENRFRFVGQAP